MDIHRYTRQPMAVRPGLHRFIKRTMKTKLISLILLFTTACTFRVEVLYTPTPESTETVIVPVESATPVVSADLSATPLALPTNTALPLPAFTATVPPTQAPLVTPKVFPIQFAPNGTYVDVIDSILAGRSKTYSINASKGQVMSVSIHQNDQAEWTYMTMWIRGADNSPLCATDCQFWRGVLPSTQLYFVTISAPSDAMDFTMRVSIDPPGTTTQSFLYENKYRNASISYTDEFAPVHFPGAEVFRIAPELALEYIDIAAYTNTNLSEAYLLFGSSTDPDVVSTCTEPISFGGPETIVGNETINGVMFTKSQGGGVAAGNIYEQTYYRTAYNGTCYEITYFIHYGDIGNYVSGTVKEFDRAALLQKFDQTLSTVVLK